LPTDSGKTLYLLDAMALAYRAHFVFISRPLINSRGQNTSATYGFTNTLLKLIEDHGIEHMAVVFDVMGEGGTFRDEMFEDYKAHRDPPPDDLVANLPLIKEVVKAMDIPVIEVEGVEADDVIGTLSLHAEKDGANVVIVSPDKDFQQLLSRRVSIFKPAYRGESFDPITEESFRDKFGLEPGQFIDVLALMGDASDNVPGVPGIGEKTAVKLVTEYGSVEELLAHAEDVKGKRAREGLLSHRDAAVLSKKLVTIKTDVDISVDWHTLRRSSPDDAVVAHLFSQLDFSSLYTRFQKIAGKGAGPAPEEPGQADLFSGSKEPAASEATILELDELEAFDETTVDYRLVTNVAELDALVEKLVAADSFALDTETTDVHAGQAWYIPTPMPDGTSTDDVLNRIAPALTSDALKIGQNIKYDVVVLTRHGATVSGPFFDTMVAHYLLAPEEAHNLDALARRFLGYRTIPITDLIGTGRSQLSMRDVSPQQVSPYACEDADVALRLAAVFVDQLAEHELDDIATTMEFPLIPVLATIEHCGIRVDAEVLAEISVEMGTDIDRLRGEIYEAAGGEFNIGSPAQLGEILFDKLGLPVVSRTSTGKPSTRENVLQRLATEHELPALILDWRELSKLKSTYVDSLPELIHPESGRVHTEFNQTVAATGRLSSSNPNLQNIPIRSERGRVIRRAFVADDGMRLMAADYVQIELRILASMSEDEALMEAFVSGQDIHTSTAARVFGIDPADVTRSQRSKAKEVNYGIPYGISPFGLAQRLRCPLDEAKTLIGDYHRSYPAVSQFLTRQVELAREMGFAQTLLGRRRFVRGIDARNRMERSAAERIAVNMPIQGTQADMIKIAMIRIQERLSAESLSARMLLQVHDELVFEVVPDDAHALAALVEKEMVEALPLKLPVEVEINVADNWLDAH
jgi:DNA polymerase-1